MSTPAEDESADLRELEGEVKTELTEADSRPIQDASGMPTDEWLMDPYAQRYEVSLRTLLGAIEAVEGGSSTGTPQTETTQAETPQADSPKADSSNPDAAAPEPDGGRAAADDDCLALVRAADWPVGAARYERMFPGLPALDPDPGQLMDAGVSGGICDAAALLDKAADGAEAAGWPFFGQLIAHDITADRSPISDSLDPEALRNARAPRLDLEILYSDGPVGSAYLYDRDDPAKFLLSPDGRDVPRNTQGVALIGEPRDDVHLIALTLHVTLLRAHNRIVDLLREAGVPEADVFDRARVTLTWHYQWVLLHDFLPRLVGQPLVNEVLAEGGRWFTPLPRHAYIPLEFSHAAFRYGHSQMRHTYQLVADGPAVPLFPDLMSFGPQPPGRHLDLAQVFDLPGQSPAQRAKRIDGRLPASLIALPEPVTGAVDVPAHRSLATRDLLRGHSTALPSGEAIARRIGARPLTSRELDRSWPNGTPLWFYVLKEAEHRADGDRLGPVGGRIVAETLIGLLRADPTSYLSLQPDWRPTLPAAGPGYSLADLLLLGTRPA